MSSDQVSIMMITAGLSGPLGRGMSPMRPNHLRCRGCGFRAADFALQAHASD